MKKDILYLGSQSNSRQKLLRIAGILYKVLEHKSDECGIDLELDFNDYVLEIAKHKMRHLTFPLELEKSEYIFVLTADTLTRTLNTKQILGKPKDKNDAIKMIEILNKEPIEVITGCCLEKKFYDNKWKTEVKKYWTTKSIVEFCVEKENLDLYLKKVPLALKACSAGVVEDFGLNFFKNIQGSYTNVIGLPLFELRQNLKNIGFKI